MDEVIVDLGRSLQIAAEMRQRSRMVVIIFGQVSKISDHDRLQVKFI
jgi:hypothetical protein